MSFIEGETLAALLAREGSVTFDVLALDLLSRRVTAGGVEVRLTPTEFELLRLLRTTPGRDWPALLPLIPAA